MASGEYLKALVRAHTEGDNERFLTIALQVAAQEARKGHAKIAQELRELVDAAKLKGASLPSGQHARPVKIAQPRGELSGLLDVDYPTIRLANMVLNPSTRAQLEQVVVEQVRRAELRSHGLEPIKKLLVVGPPGTGKTMTAAALAGELGLPLFTVRIDALITKYLGETAGRLRLIFDSIRDVRGVYLFDEFDAIGVERAAGNEVGEIRRTLNTFLLLLEGDDSDSIIVAATNHPRLLDSALFRRFDVVIKYYLPSKDAIKDLIRSRLCLFGTSGMEWHRVVEAAEGLSHADISRACDSAAKRALLAHRREIGTDDLIAMLQERRNASIWEG